MILEKVPPLLVFTLDRALDSEQQNKLEKLEALETLTAEQTDEYIELMYERDEASKGFKFKNWVPIPIHADIIDAQPTGYQTTTVKRIKMVSGEPVLTGTVNSVTINIKTNSGMLINALLALADYMFALEDSFPRIHFFSPKAVVIGGCLLSMTRQVQENTTEQIVTLEIQKGTESVLSAVKEKATELVEMVGFPS
ncbi:hypothetical protein IHC92_20780 [Photobacterium damselae subsp. damselae]|uniref:hypothetical protein n=1 Tax=Photobacterium damselae TaxID=38293 RepID=UPI001F189927|nr:hypothetical protein [Photobacterium damselae]UKA23390.1 hypothetical protein IHC92_20780 [Photobacterium damselae subsp. damselae]